MEEKPLTLSQLIEYGEKSLIPQLEEKFVSKREFSEFKDKIYKDIDYLIEKVDKLVENNEIRNYQEDKEKEFFAILVKSLKDKNILSQEELEKIAKLNIF